MRENIIVAMSLSDLDVGNTSSSKLPNLMYSDPGFPSMTNDEDFLRESNASMASPRCYSGENSPYAMSPWNQTLQLPQSPGNSTVMPFPDEDFSGTGLIGSFVREEGHIYSLAASGKLLYTGSDSKNIRVWENQKEWSGFKSKSGLVKAIIISGDKIFTGHQDGKIRVWMISSKNPKSHKRIGTLPRFKDFIRCSIKPSNYVKVRRHRNSLWIKHYDAISCLSLNEDQSLLYSGSWDKTFKVWRIADSKCLESITAHDDAVNSIVSGFEGLVFTGSADGTVKIWKMAVNGKATKHTLVQTLLKQECAVTALALDSLGSVFYCGSSDGLVNFWEREKQLSHGGVLRGHKLAVLCLAADGNLVFSGSADKTICVWRRDARGIHSCLSVLNGHTGPVKCIAVVQDKETACFDDKRWIVYSGSLDKSVKVWKVSPNPHVPQQLDGFASQHVQAAGLASRSSFGRLSSSKRRC